MLDLSGKTALVSGASRGLGRHVAAGLARAGACVALVARDGQQLAQVANEIRAAGGQARTFAADVSQIDAVERLRASVAAELGEPAVLVAAAGVFGPIQPIVDSDPARWIETLAVNTVGPYLLCRALAPAMIGRGWGRIILFSSAATLHIPGPLNSAYGTSKVALNQFTRHLAAELAGSGVTANCIHPGEVKTQMWADIRQESQATGPAGEGYRVWAEQVAQSGGDPPELALELVLELIDARSSDVNGRFLWIRGGMQTPLPSW